MRQPRRACPGARRLCIWGHAHPPPDRRHPRFRTRRGLVEAALVRAAPELLFRRGCGGRAACRAWGGGPPHPKVTLKPGRTDFELAATRAALAADKPVLGICGGQQLLAVAFGGTLVQHIPDEVPGALPHEQPNPRTEPGHEVSIAAGTLLARIVGTARMAVNSAHHQAVATAGAGVVNALAPDGVVEGVEHPGHRFALGVQWHPEYAVDPRDPAIFAAFVEACR